jgi:hypothetical protein
VPDDRAQETSLKILRVRVQARSKSPGVERLAAGEFRVRVAAAPEKGRANREVIERLARFLGIPPSCVAIIRGQTSSQKWIRLTRPEARGSGPKP